MSFEEEWAQLKQDALRRREAAAGMQLASAGPGSGPGPAAGDLGLQDGPIRAKTSQLYTVQAEAQGKSQLDDAVAVGRVHSGWEAGGASNVCVEAWQKRLRELARMAENAANSVTAAMDQLIGDDVSVATRIRLNAELLEES
ncbi:MULTISPECIES: apurinic/apyrimidinic endonuclease family protein [Streptomyces]|uniref:Uncharacterized protein n=1 Tax=Streptomyces tsukubensis (strain DSM 42081 / NBRC 108919 / NRRL 18488 / 9993) TaxID=1114943 RepID=I2N0N4_STRT9|nr:MULTISPECIES: hypothetical protein [Streptomyces]AZK94788.1 hypothetical protein B7R87_13625 [Streptomyces tsukubensis]EIF90581.1 hypothetical protein [Streptomyces tsukubensis NRRL18488]MYS68717.1 hypothetical protein [Streptomyces sp. SID5473]QKM69130.1 hypothetical protein STSU_020145 [Streptomyces tsukubensis NRRL18488]TAI42940.1 hypothetical protein EWI31_21390 [Streptomyces tsukubensis]